MRRRLGTLVCVVATAPLAVAVPALAAPAGDEYLPAVPKAAGDEVVANEDQGSGATIVAPEARGQPADSGSKVKKDNDPQDDDPVRATADMAASIADDDPRGGGGALDTLLDPVVLLLLVGTVAAAVGMTLRRRGSGDGDDEGARPAPDRAKPATPDGEIVAGGEQRS